MKAAEPNANEVTADMTLLTTSPAGIATADWTSRGQPGLENLYQ